jgi:hypothetical protein
VTVKPDNEPAKKKPYAKPEVRRVMLRAEEAVLGACKTASSGQSGPGGSGNRCSVPSACSSLGS